MAPSINAEMKRLIELIQKILSLNTSLKLNNQKEYLPKILAITMAVYSEIGKPLKAVYLFPPKAGEYFEDTVYGEPLESEVILAHRSKIILMSILAETILSQKIDTRSIEIKLNKLYKEFKREFPEKEDFINCMCRYLKLVVPVLENQAENIECYAKVLMDKGKILIVEDFPNHFMTPADHNMYCY